MKIKDQIKLQKPIQVPYHVWTAFGTKAKVILLMGDQFSLAEEADYVNIEKARKAIEWYADQLGGKVKWEKV